MRMKKLINDAYAVTDELVEGFVLANQGRYHKLPGVNAVVRTDMPQSGRVGVVIGGGSGHEPLFIGFLGPGLGDAGAHGAVFTSPAPDLILAAAKAVDGGAGVLFVYGNYQGDNLNFDLAGDLAAGLGIQTRTIRVWDDIASAPPERKEDRRGTAADVFVIKAAGAAAQKGLDLDAVYRLAAKARDNCRSLGVALSSCTLPTSSGPIFELGEAEISLGMGLHGEEGVERGPLESADMVATKIVNRLLADDLDLAPGCEVNLLVNGYGATTMMELLIVYRRVHRLLAEKGITVYDSLVGSFCTSQEMAGCSVTVLKLDDELKELWDAPCDSPALTKWPRGGGK